MPGLIVSLYVCELPSQLPPSIKAAGMPRFLTMRTLLKDLPGNFKISLIKTLHTDLLLMVLWLLLDLTIIEKWLFVVHLS